MSNANENCLDGPPPLAHGQPSDEVLLYAPTPQRQLPKWLTTWSMISLVLCGPLLIVNVLSVAVPEILDRAIETDPEYLACIVAVPILLSQALVVISLLYFVQFARSRRRCIWHLCLHAVVGVLAVGGLLILGEQYVSIH